MKNLYLSLAILANGAALFGDADSMPSQKWLGDALNLVLNGSDIKRNAALESFSNALETAALLNSEGDTANALSVIRSATVSAADPIVYFPSFEIRKSLPEGLPAYILKNRLLTGKDIAAPYSSAPAAPTPAQPTVQEPSRALPGIVPSSSSGSSSRKIIIETLTDPEAIAPLISEAIRQVQNLSASAKALLPSGFAPNVEQELNRAMAAIRSGSVKNALDIISNVNRMLMGVPSHTRSAFLKPLVGSIAGILYATRA